MSYIAAGAAELALARGLESTLAAPKRPAAASWARPARVAASVASTKAWAPTTPRRIPTLSARARVQKKPRVGAQIGPTTATRAPRLPPYATHRPPLPTVTTHPPDPVPTPPVKPTLERGATTVAEAEAPKVIERVVTRTVPGAPKPAARPGTQIAKPRFEPTPGILPEVPSPAPRDAGPPVLLYAGAALGGLALLYLLTRR